MSATTAFRATSITFQPVAGDATQVADKVHLMVRAGTLSWRPYNGGTAQSVSGVLSVERAGNRTFRITTADGVYTAVQDRNCGCRG